MSQNRKLSSLVSMIALFGATGLLAAACGGGETADGDSCATINGRVSALQDSSAALTGVAAGIKTEVVGACADIAGMTAPANATDSDVTNICNAAKARIDAALQANANLSFVIVPPQCTVDAQAQLNCESECYAKADVECQPGEVTARCDPGELSVECSGTCNVNAYCEGSADVGVECAGECQGSCEGTCDGVCEGTCEGSTDSGGKCTGTCKGTCSTKCEGTCKGSCKVTATGGVNCGANARCKGGCTGTATAPKCEANLKPPSCEGSASAQCNADCEGSASLKANCTEPTVDIVGTIDAELRGKLTTALPKLIRVSGQGELALNAVTDLGKNFASVAANVGSCTLDVGANVVGQFTAAASATASATASVSVSFEASASVSGSAAAGG